MSSTLADRLLGLPGFAGPGTSTRDMVKEAFTPPAPVPPGPDVPPDANAMVPPPPVDPATGMPMGGAPGAMPMDPSMMMLPGGTPMPQVDPATGMPMGGAPGAMPMDPSMMMLPGGTPMPPVDPATGMPLDPAAMPPPPMDMGAMPSGDPTGGEMIPASQLDELMAPVMERLEEMAETIDKQQQRLEALEGSVASPAAVDRQEPALMEDSPAPEDAGGLPEEPDDATPGEMSEQEDIEDSRDMRDNDTDAPMETDKRPGDGADKSTMTPFSRLMAMQDRRRE